jgi:hypothetical protein
VKLKEYWPAWWAAQRIGKLGLASLTGSVQNPLPLIVTLTSIPPRLPTLHLTIRSVLNQSQPPELIVLWLHKDLRDKLPERLAELQSERFVIRYGELSCSHRKLIHAVEEFPGRILVTCDDDLIYDESWLERLYAAHCSFPFDVIAHECRKITSDSVSGELLTYKEWSVTRGGAISAPELMSVGYGGVLYPPGVLSDLVTDVDLFTRLAPKADDLWFKAMSLIAGRSVRTSNRPDPKPIPVIGSQKFSLLKTNVRQDGNRMQWKALCDYFDIGL